MADFIRRLWCAVRGHGGIDLSQYQRWVGTCKRCGATVDARPKE